MSPKQQQRPLPLLLTLSFCYDFNIQHTNYDYLLVFFYICLANLQRDARKMVDFTNAALVRKLLYSVLRTFCLSLLI